MNSDFDLRVSTILKGAARMSKEDEDGSGEDIEETESEEEENDDDSNVVETDDDDEEGDAEEEEEEILDEDDSEDESEEEESDEEEEVTVREHVANAKAGNTAWFASEFERRISAFPDLCAISQPCGYDLRAEIMPGAQKCAVTGKGADVALVFRQGAGPPATVYVRKRKAVMDIVAHLFTLSCFAQPAFVEYRFQTSDMLSRWFIAASRAVDEFVAPSRKNRVDDS